jgi:hypothetical protein
MFNPWPLGGSSNDIPAMMKDLADRYTNHARKNPPKAKITSDIYHIQQFAGGQCHGSYVLFEDSEATYFGHIVSTMFFMYVDGRVWSGQFTGSRDEWDQALPVLKSLKADN